MRGGAVLLVAGCIVASGCGAMMHGSTTQIAVASRPTGAHAWVDGMYVGVTPIRVMVPSRQPHELVLRAEGHQERRMTLQPTVTDGYIVMDATFGFPWSLLVDWVGGALVDTTPGRIRVRLPEGESPTTPVALPTRAQPVTRPGDPAGEPLRPEGY